MSHDNRTRTARQRRRRWGASAVGVGAAAGAALAAAMIPAGIAAADDLVGDAADVATLAAAAPAATDAAEAARMAAEPARMVALPPGVAELRDVAEARAVAQPAPGEPVTTGSGGTEPVATAPTAPVGTEPVTTMPGEPVAMPVEPPGVVTLDNDLNTVLGDLGVPSSDFSGLDMDLNDVLNNLPASVLSFLDTVATDIFGSSAADATALMP